MFLSCRILLCLQTMMRNEGVARMGVVLAADMMKKNEFSVGPWSIYTTRSHILKSHCERSKDGCPSDDVNSCNVCRYSSTLELPSLPEMVFPDNCLRLVHTSNVELIFNALDALRMVDAHSESLSVAGSLEWRSTRKGLEEVKDKVKPYDWTFTTAYKGTYYDKEKQLLKVEESSEAIDYHKLKQQEQILFYDDIVLFEDELADNGIAELRVKIRVMASGFFILMRFFLRVDGVLVRFNDTRLYHAAQTNHILREFSTREESLPNPRLPLPVLKDINKLSELLPYNNVTTHKLIIPH